MKKLKLIYLFILGLIILSCDDDDNNKNNPSNAVEIQVTELTNSSALEYFGGNAMAQFNGQLWLAGGDVQNNQNSNFLIYKSSNGVNWNDISHNAPTTTRYAPSLTVFNNNLWLIGGLNTLLSLHTDVLRSSDGENWTTVVANAPFGKTTMHHTFVLGNKLFLVTGYQALPVPTHNKVWSTTNGTDWVEENSAAFPYRYGSSFVQFQNEYYVVGGTTDGNTFLNEIWKSADGINWSQVATNGTIFSGRAYHTTTTHNGKVWLIGGETASTPAAELWYSPNMMNWRQYTDLPSGAQAIKLHNALDYNGKIWLFGGEYFNASDNAWKLQGKIQTVEEL